MNKATIILSIVLLSIIVSCIFVITGGSYLYLTSTSETPISTTTTSTTSTTPTMSTTPRALEIEETIKADANVIQAIPAIKADANVIQAIPAIKAVQIKENVVSEISDDKRLNFTEKEVFLYSNPKTGGWTKSDAYYECPDNTVLATEEQLKEAQANGADWCAYGWTTGRAGYPQKTGGVRGCSDAGSKTYFEEFPSTTKRGINCYGIKPNKSTADRGNNITINPFNNTKWSQFST